MMLRAGGSYDSRREDVYPPRRVAVLGLSDWRALLRDAGRSD